MKAALLAWLLAIANPVLAVEVDIRAAWGGAGVLSAFTELEVGIRSPESGSFTLQMPGAKTRTQIELDLPEAEGVQFKVPYPIERPGPVRWQVERDGVIVSEGMSEVFSRVARNPWEVDLTMTSEQSRTLNLLPAALPEWTQAYDVIRSLTLTPQALRILTDAQLEALDGYLQRCGRLVLRDASSELLMQLRGLSGCGGRHIDTGTGTLFPTEIPAADDLIELAECVDCGSTLWQVTSVFSAYVLLLVTASLTCWPRTLIALGVSTSFLLVVMYRSNAPFVTWLSWSQAEAASPIQVRRTVLIVEGRAHSDLTLPVPHSSVVSRPLPEGSTLHYSITDGTTLTVPTGFLSRHALSFIDAGPVETGRLEPPAEEAAALAERMERRTGLSLNLGVREDTIEHPTIGQRRTWHATVEPDGGSAW